MSKVSPCFTPGTQIATSRGWQPVETLRRGDRVVTRDNGLRKIAWVGRRDLSYGDLQEVPMLRPVLVRKGAFGHGAPARDMLVSPKHRFLVEAEHPVREEVLIGAERLIDGRVIRMAPVLGVSYLHILLEAHEVILANGAWTESFHPDDETMKSLDHGMRDEIISLFPEVVTLGAARRFPAAREIRQSRFES
jgi:hypothetical protein